VRSYGQPGKGLELITNKSGANTSRYNTFLDSPGARLTLRHGNDCLVYGNTFRRTDGIRIFGDRTYEVVDPGATAPLTPEAILRLIRDPR
jgi:hypothetical protein